MHDFGFFGVKNSPYSKEKLPLALKDFRDKSPCYVTDANSSTSLHSKSPIGTSKEKNYFNRSNSFTSPFLMTMSVMATSTTSVEEQLA